MLEQTTIDIGRYARVPYHVATAKIHPGPLALASTSFVWA